jgi:hypothetical protein
MDPMWVSGNNLTLTISSPDGPLYEQSLAITAVLAQMTDGEVLRYTFDLADVEEDTTHSGAARIMIELLPDPRTAIPDAAPAPAGPFTSPHLTINQRTGEQA